MTPISDRTATATAVLEREHRSAEAVVATMCTIADRLEERA
jgi:hypothetical protein